MNRLAVIFFQRCVASAVPHEAAPFSAHRFAALHRGSAPEMQRCANGARAVLRFIVP
jgi:hypothetical protein